MQSPRPLLKGTPALTNNELAKEAKCEDLEKVAVGDTPEKFIHVGSQLPPQERQKLIEFLRKNVDVFAWNAYKAPRVDLSFICHHLNVNPSVTQKKKNLLDAHPESILMLSKTK